MTNILKSRRRAGVAGVSTLLAMLLMSVAARPHAAPAAARMSSLSDGELLRGIMFGTGPGAAYLPEYHVPLAAAAEARRVGQAETLAALVERDQPLAVSRFAALVRTGNPLAVDSALTTILGAMTVQEQRPATVASHGRGMREVVMGEPVVGDVVAVVCMFVNCVDITNLNYVVWIIASDMSLTSDRLVKGSLTRERFVGTVARRMRQP